VVIVRSNPLRIMRVVYHIHQLTFLKSRERGIRTPDTFTGMPDFKSGAFNQLCHLSIHTIGLMMLDTSVFTYSKTCWSYPIKKSVLNVVVGRLTDHISTYPFSYSQSGLTRKVVIMEIPTNSMSTHYSIVVQLGLEPRTSTL
jgi:hypothetical protein